MESRVAEMPFSADWEAVRWVTSRPRELFRSLPFEATVSGEEPFEVYLRIKKRLMTFEFSGRMSVTFAEATATYVMKGPKGLLILATSVDGDRLVSRASADLVGRFIGRKLEVLVNGFGFAVCRFSESYRRIVGKVLPTGESEFYVRNMGVDDLPHLLRYFRFKLGRESFSLLGRRNGEEFKIHVENDSVKSLEHKSSGGSAIVEVNKSLLEVEQDDFSGIELGGEYFIFVT
ncbi:hypothetical protein [Thermococcus sp.]